MPNRAWEWPVPGKWLQQILFAPEVSVCPGMIHLSPTDQALLLYTTVSSYVEDTGTPLNKHSCDIRRPM